MIVPLAIPAVAGPSALAVLMLMTQVHSLMTLTIAPNAAWLIASLILLCATPLHRILGPAACLRSNVSWYDIDYDVGSNDVERDPIFRLQSRWVILQPHPMYIEIINASLVRY